MAYQPTPVTGQSSRRSLSRSCVLIAVDLVFVAFQTTVESSAAAATCSMVSGINFFGAQSAESIFWVYLSVSFRFAISFRFVSLFPFRVV